MEQHGIERIPTFDTGFELISWCSTDYAGEFVALDVQYLEPDVFSERVPGCQLRRRHEFMAKKVVGSSCCARECNASALPRGSKRP
jgi:hypothetical protein